MSTKKYTDVTPYDDNDRSKKKQVADMFDRIAGNYDFLNHFLSLGIDRLWRKQAVKALESLKPKNILDVATGTGDLAIDLNKKLNTEKIVGLDIAVKMLEVGRIKAQKKNLSDKIEFIEGDSENIPFEDSSFDATTAAFGVRNFQNPLAGLTEMNRVTRPGGKIVVLEFSKPRGFLFKHLYTFYFNNILPTIGRLLSKDPKAYRYLHDSVQAFPDYENFTALLDKAGYKNTQYKALTFGICCIYQGTK